MIKQKNVVVKTGSANLTVSEMGEIICNSTSEILLFLPRATTGLWYRVCNANTGVVMVGGIGSFGDPTTISLSQYEQALFLANGTSNWWMSKSSSGVITKEEVEAVLTGEISSHTHPGEPLIGASAPTNATVGIVGQFYIEATTPKLYYCTDDSDPYIWNEVGSTYTLPQATSSILGGVKASTKNETHTQLVYIDDVTGFLYVPPAGAAANGLPTGGTTDQILAKNSDTDYDTKWIDAPTGGAGEDIWGAM